MPANKQGISLALLHVGRGGDSGSGKNRNNGLQLGGLVNFVVHPLPRLILMAILPFGKLAPVIRLTGQPPVLAYAKIDIMDTHMPALTIRNLPDDIHRGLKALAARHGRSTEAEVREIIAAAVRPEQRLKMGEALWNLGRNVGLTNEEAAAIDAGRDRTPADPIVFQE